MHEATDLIEAFDVSLPRALKRILAEVWKDLFHEIANASYLELQRLVRSVRSDEATFPHPLDLVEQFSAVSVLTDREARSDFPAKTVSFAGNEGDAETAFAVYITRDVR